MCSIYISPEWDRSCAHAYTHTPSNRWYTMCLYTWTVRAIDDVMMRRRCHACKQAYRFLCASTRARATSNEWVCGSGGVLLGNNARRWMNITTAQHWGRAAHIHIVYVCMWYAFCASIGNFVIWPRLAAGIFVCGLGSFVYLVYGFCLGYCARDAILFMW